ELQGAPNIAKSWSSSIEIVAGRSPGHCVGPVGRRMVSSRARATTARLVHTGPANAGAGPDHRRRLDGPQSLAGLRVFRGLRESADPSAAPRRVRAAAGLFRAV